MQGASSEEKAEKQNAEFPMDDSSESSSDEDDSEYDSDDDEMQLPETGYETEDENDRSPEATFRRVARILDSKKKWVDKHFEATDYESLFDFPEDTENWRERDLGELWVDPPKRMQKPGLDPIWADEEDVDIILDEIENGEEAPVAPFYIPYIPPYPVIPDNHVDISTPKLVVEELDRIEEFLQWVSYIFNDGSSYEGTVWDDLAHGKGVYVSDDELVRYRGEWVRNSLDGHGVLEVDVPSVEPIPGSKLEAKMRAEGKIISRDYMSPEEKKWLEMTIEDYIHVAGARFEVPWEENEEWIRQYGKLPEKGHYRYSGQWKHSHMHGCGVYEVNEKVVYGKFYFGKLLERSAECDADASMLHAGIAEVAAAKAQMFVNKPDGMVREKKGLYTDPQHPYLYEDHNMWMAPGFINQFFEVPDDWKKYVKDVDAEREMWLNSFYKSPLRIPMPAELSYWWEEGNYSTEFAVVNKDSETEDASKFIKTEDPLILHIPTGRLINYVEDEEYGLRLFWQPSLKDGEDVDLSKVEFLPLGYDEFYGLIKATPQKDSILLRAAKAMENVLTRFLENVKKSAEEQKIKNEKSMKLLEEELEVVEAQLCLEEAMENLDDELSRKLKDDERKAMMDEMDREEVPPAEIAPASDEQGDEDEDEVEVEDEDEDAEDEDAEDEELPTSFGSTLDQDERDSPKNNREDGEHNKKPPFSSSFASASLAAIVPFNQQYSPWKPRLHNGSKHTVGSRVSMTCFEAAKNCVKFSRTCSYRARLQAVHQRPWLPKKGYKSQFCSLARMFSENKASLARRGTMCNKNSLQDFEASMELQHVLSLQVPI